jgi:recombinational DNA repair protein RecR
VELADGTKLVVTIHPSALLRIEDEGDKHAAYHALVDDLKAARPAAGKETLIVQTLISRPSAAAPAAVVLPSPRRLVSAPLRSAACD